MNWEDCLKQKVKKIKADEERAKHLMELAVKRLNSVKRRRGTDDPEFIVEDYYETVKELITALLFMRGYKSYSHECLITFLEEHHPEFEKDDVKLVNQLREIRNDLQYRGEPLATGFLQRREKEITNLIEKLFRSVEKNLEK